MAFIGGAARRTLPHPIYRIIRKHRVAHIIRQYSARSHSGTYGGHRLEVQFEDPLAEGWYGHDWPVLPEVETLRGSSLRPGARVFDLGAHQGVVALMLAREVGNGGDVLAVEAEPHNARLAEVNKGLNHASNLTVLHAAVSDTEGVVAFAPSLNGSIDDATHIGNIDVPAVTIDALASRYGMPDLVFVDIEGYEGRALRAAQQVIASGAAFFVEIHVEKLVGATPDEVIEMFDGRERLVAANPGGDTASHGFVPFDGNIPDSRFYLLAL